MDNIHIIGRVVSKIKLFTDKMALERNVNGIPIKQLYTRTKRVACYQQIYITYIELDLDLVNHAFRRRTLRAAYKSNCLPKEIIKDIVEKSFVNKSREDLIKELSDEIITN